MSSSVEGWLNQEFEYLNLGDKRLDKRLKKVALGLTENSEKNISSSFDSWGEIKGAYRFFDNPKVTNEKIIYSHNEKTEERIRSNNRVLLLQDTVYFTYGDNRGGTKKLDVCRQNYSSKKK